MATGRQAGRGAVTPQTDYLLVGRVRRAHGIRGEVFVETATDNEEVVYAAGRTLWLGDPGGTLFEPETRLEIARARPFKKDGVLVKFEGVPDRNAAEMLRGRSLLIPREEAPPLEEAEYFLHDLAGLEVQTIDGEPVGHVAEIYEVGTSHVLGVDAGDREVLIPFSERIIREVDLEKGSIVVDPPPGLLDL